MPKRYEDMSRPERRVAIAKDTLKWLDDGVFGKVERARWYVERLTRRYSPPEPTYDGEPFKPDVAKRMAKNCAVCARGALLLSKIGNHNSASLDIIEDCVVMNRLIDDHGTTIGLQDAFTERMLSDIEKVFEHSKGRGHWSTGSQMSDEDMLRSICQNIIDHEGEFKPGVEYEVFEV